MVTAVNSLVGKVISTLHNAIVGVKNLITTGVGSLYHAAKGIFRQPEGSKSVDSIVHASPHFSNYFLESPMVGALFPLGESSSPAEPEASIDSGLTSSAPSSIPTPPPAPPKTKKTPFLYIPPPAAQPIPEPAPEPRASLLSPDTVDVLVTAHIQEAEVAPQADEAELRKAFEASLENDRRRDAFKTNYQNKFRQELNKMDGTDHVRGARESSYAALGELFLLYNPEKMSPQTAKRVKQTLDKQLTGLAHFNANKTGSKAEITKQKIQLLTALTQAVDKEIRFLQG